MHYPNLKACLLVLFATGTFDARAIDCPAQTAAAIRASTSLDSAISGLSRLRIDCSHDERFAVSLALRLSQAGSYSDSQSIIDAALPSAISLRDNLTGIWIMNLMGKKATQEARRLAEESAKRSPGYAMFYSLLSEMDANEQRWDAAYPNIKRATELDPDALNMLTLATIAFQLHRYEEVVELVTKAHQLEPQRIAHVPGIPEAAVSLARLNRVPEARALLTRHIRANPEWRKSKQIVAAGQAVGLQVRAE